MANILLLEDEPVLAGLIRSALHVDGHRISEMMGIPTASELDGQRHANFDLILAEVSQGVNFARLLSARNHAIKIMFMTDHSSVVGAIYSLQDGVCVLEKPFSANKLRRTVRETLVREPKRRSHSRRSRTVSVG